MERERGNSQADAVLTRVRRKIQPWGLTVSYLARHMGVSRQYIWQAINGRARVSLQRSEQLEAAVDGIIMARRHMSTFGGRLRAARIAAGLTLKQVAALIGYSWVGVERWEKDLCLPKPGVLWHLLSLYGIEGEELIAASPSQRTLLHLQHGAREELARSVHLHHPVRRESSRSIHREKRPPFASEE